MTLDMNGRVALVTGASSGIGRAAAEAFGRAGCSVVLASRGGEAGEAAAAAIRDAGGTALWVRADVSRGDEVEALLRRTLDSYGRLDYAFNNGGSGGREGRVADISEADWRATIDGFLTSVWLCLKHEIPAMLATGGGAIVNNASVDGERAFPMAPAYSAAKHGVLGLTKSVALQYAQEGIRVNAVCPGWIRTPPVQEAIDRRPDALARMMQHQPIGRLGTPEEVADAVVWLCSERASFVVGTALAVDGGYLAV